MLYNVLKKVNFNGKIVIIDSDNNLHEFGSGNQLVRIKLTNKSIERKLFFNPSLHIGEAYMNEELIIEKGTIEELINLVKSENLIDIRTPAFLNVKLDLNKKSNLVKLNSKLRTVDLIENVYVQEFNKDYMNLRIKYLGKLDKIVSQLKKININLSFVNEQWIIRTL